MPVQDSVDQLKVNKTSLSFAKSRLGEPALILGNKSQYLPILHRSPIEFCFEPKVVSRDVLVLFNKKEIKKLEKFNLKDGESFQMNKTLPI